MMFKTLPTVELNEATITAIVNALKFAKEAGGEGIILHSGEEVLEPHSFLFEWSASFTEANPTYEELILGTELALRNVSIVPKASEQISGMIEEVVKHTAVRMAAFERVSHEAMELGVALQASKFEANLWRERYEGLAALIRTFAKGVIKELEEAGYGHNE